MVLHGLQKADYIYDDDGNITLEQFSSWHYLDGWIPGVKFEMVYDDENFLVERTRIWWSTDTYEWIISEKEVYDYNEQANLNEIILFIWNSAGQNLEIDKKYTHIYNESGGLTERIISRLIENEWRETHKAEFTLNNENKVITWILFTWLQFEEIWEPQSKMDFTYNGSGLEVGRISSFWNESTYVPFIKWERTYDALNDVISVETYYSDFIESYWIEDNLKTFEYDEEGNMIEFISHTWEPTSEQYLPQAKSLNAFDLNYLAANIMKPAPHPFPDLMANEHNNMVLVSAFFYISADEWIEGGTTQYYYSSLELSSLNVDPADILLVFPNPFRETIRFKSSEPLVRFTLFDLQGRVISRKQLVGTEEVNVGELPSGMYVYQIEGLNTRQIGKLVRE